MWDIWFVAWSVVDGKYEADILPDSLGYYGGTIYAIVNRATTQASTFPVRSHTTVN